jgi:hypothetical protein
MAVTLTAVEDAEPDGEDDCRQDDHDDLAWPSSAVGSSVHGNSSGTTAATGLPCVPIRHGFP